ncbi:MAG: hypothetical protein IPG09_08895 [Ignavibacteria bacterium]|nr:hypothetical protein [Ignavibacteria bacterium]
MKENIKLNIDNPQELEKLYRTDKSSFKQEFNLLYPDLKENKLADFWNERLNYESPDITWGSRGEFAFVIIASLLAGFIAKIPAYLPVDEFFFYTRNAGFVIFPILIFYFAWKNKLSLKKILIITAAILFALIFINLLPHNNESNTLILSCIHLPLFLWSVLGFAFTGNRLNNYKDRIEYLRYNGDLIVITAIILIAGVILSGLTVGLFSLIGLQIVEFYREYIGIFGLSAAPIIGTYAVQKNPQLVNKVSPVIAKIFSPLVLITLIVYIIAIIATGKDPYNDRQFLLTFNGLLIVVMAIIVFSLAETSRSKRNRTEITVLFLLTALTIIVNGIALSAIVFRISEWGITPNRLAVLGGNILILTNLLLVSYKLLMTLLNKSELENVEKLISIFLPVYGLWTVIVVFIFPLIFNFR